MQQQVHKIEISSRTIVFTVVFLLVLKVLWLVQDLLISLFIAFMIMSVAKPVVSKLEKRRIPRALSALVLLLGTFTALGYGISFIIPLLISDMTAFAKNIAVLTENIDPSIAKYINGKSIADYIPNFTNQIIPLIRNLFSNLVFVITTLFFSFYFIVEENFIRNFLQKFFKERQAAEVADIFDKTEKRIGSWFWGEIVLMTIIGILTYIGLSLIGVKHALTLAVIAGLLEVFPVIGPIISAVPAFIFAINQSYFLALSVIALYIIIQQLENNLIVPAVMKKAIGLNKILILIVLITGGRLAGVLGLFIAIPLTLSIETILTEVTKNK